MQEVQLEERQEEVAEQSPVTPSAAKMIAPDLLALMTKAVEYKEKIATAKTKVKRDLYTKKLNKVNAATIRLARVYNLISKAQGAKIAAQTGVEAPAE